MAVLLATGTADPDGNVTLRFAPPGSGVAYGGTIAVPLSPPAAVWTASLAGTPIGSWSGPSSWGPVVASGSEELVLAGQGLAAGQTVQAAWTGSQGSPETYARVIPAATANHGTATITGPVSATISGNVPVEPVSGSVWDISGTVSAPTPTSIVALAASGASPLAVYSPAAPVPARWLLATVAAASTAGYVELSLGTLGALYLWAPLTPAAPVYLPLEGADISAISVTAVTTAGNLAFAGGLAII